MGRETEYKFILAPSQFDSFLEQMSSLPGAREIRMHTTYYDTPSRSLSHRHYTLRRRMENDTPVYTVKAPAGHHSRGEWECVCDDIHTALPKLCSLGAPADLLDLTEEGLEPVCGARFTRLCVTRPMENLVVEYALDRGELLGGGNHQPFQELEIELKSGSEESFHSAVQNCAWMYHLHEQSRSKFSRALALAGEVR